MSLGGYYAPRAAAFDKRIKACIALGGPFNWGAAWDGSAGTDTEAFRVRSHCKTQDEARKNAATLSLEGVAQNITCPLFIVNGRLDRIVPATDAERLAREAKGPVELMMIEDGNHIATNRAYRWRSQSADWMKEHWDNPHAHSREQSGNPHAKISGCANPRGIECNRSIPVSVINTISPVCTPALPSRVTTFGWITTVWPARNGSCGTGPGRAALAAKNRRQIAATIAVQKIVDDGEAGLLNHA